MGNPEQIASSQQDRFISPRGGRKPSPLPIDVHKMPVGDFMRVLPTPTQRDVVAKLTILGDPPTLQQIANEEGVTRQAIHSRVKGARRRLERYKRGEPVRKKRSYLQIPFEQLEDLKNPNLTHAEISRKYGIPWSTVQSRRRNLVSVKMGRPRKEKM